MKLIYSPVSPYARKCRVLVEEVGLADKVELVHSHPFDNEDVLLQANPLGRVPCLILDDGVALTESMLIADYLNSVAPRAWSRDLADRRMEALGNGLTDLVLNRRVERAREEATYSDYWISRREAGIARALDQLDREMPVERASIGGLTVATALEYLEFRYPECDWRPGRSKLAAHLDAWRDVESFRETSPAEPA